MSRAALLLSIFVALAAGMMVFDYLLVYYPPLYNALANSPIGTSGELMSKFAEKVWIYQSIIWTSLFAFSLIAIIVFLYNLIKDDLR